MENPLSIIEAHAPTVVLAECGYRTNTIDRRILDAPEGRAAIVTALRGTVIRAWELIHELRA